MTQLIYCFKANRQYYVLWTFEVSIKNIKKLWRSEVRLVKIRLKPSLVFKELTYNTHSLFFMWMSAYHWNGLYDSTLYSGTPDTIGTSKCVLLIEVSFVEGSFNILKYQNGTSKVSLVVRCPLFRGVLYKGIHCITCTDYTYHLTVTGQFYGPLQIVERCRELRA